MPSLAAAFSSILKAVCGYLLYSFFSLPYLGTAFLVLSCYGFEGVTFSASISLLADGYSDSMVSSSNEMILIYWVGAFYALLILFLVGVQTVLFSLFTGLSDGSFDIVVSLAQGAQTLVFYSSGWGNMISTMLFQGLVVSCLVFSYFYVAQSLTATFLSFTYSFGGGLVYSEPTITLVQFYANFGKFSRYIFSSMACVLSLSSLFFCSSGVDSGLLLFSVGYLATLSFLGCQSTVLIELSVLLGVL